MARLKEVVQNRLFGIRVQGIVDTPPDNTYYNVSTPTPSAQENEGQSGTYTVTFTTTRNGITNIPSTVDYAITGTATITDDYTGVASGTISFDADEVVKNITVDVVGDVSPESDETVIFTISNPSVGIINTDSVTFTILNDDFDINYQRSRLISTTITEAHQQAGFRIERSGYIAGTSSFQWEFTGTATPGVDYTSDNGSYNGTHTFNPGETQADFYFTSVQDPIFESNETVNFITSNFTAPGGSVTFQGNFTNPITITSDDSGDVSYAVATNTASLSESTTNVTFTITRSGYLLDATTVDYAFSGTATFNDDYVMNGGTAGVSTQSGTINFASGESTKTIVVQVQQDIIYEASPETIILTISNGTAPGTATISTASATTTVNNDDTGNVNYSVAASTATVTEGNSGSQQVVFTVTRSGYTAITTTVNYALTGTATSDSDYNNIGGTSGASGTSGTITFNTNETTKTVTLDVLGDTDSESDETIIFTLSSPSTAGVQSNSYGTQSTTVTILNDDAGGGLTTYVHDTFSGAANGNIDGRTPDTVTTNGNTWAYIRGNAGVGIDGSGNVITNNGSYNVAIVNATVADVTFTSHIAGINQRVYYNSLSTSNRCFVQINSTSNIDLRRRINNSESSAAVSNNANITIGTSILKIVTNGDNVKVYVDDVLKIDYTKTNRDEKNWTRFGYGTVNSPTTCSSEYKVEA